MKYLEALNKRKLSLENLPKSLQKKISELNSQIKALKEIEDIPADDLQESDIEDIKQIRKNLLELDTYIEHKVNIFDQAKYERKLEQISKFSEIKKNKKEGVVKEEETNTTHPTQKESKVVEFDHIKEPLVTKVVAKEPIQTEPSRIEKQLPSNQYDEKDYVDSSFNEYYAQGQTKAVEPQYHQATEENEFERQGEGNPKKMTTGLILMGVGAFFLTWGAVNFFKSRR